MDRNKIIIKTSVKGIAVNVALAAFKAVVGFFSNSIAIILDSVNNLTDAFSSIITIVGAKLSGRAPDKKHPYGHGRTEYITAVIIAEIVLLAGVIAGKESLEKIIHPVKPEYSPVTFLIIGVAVLVKFFFGRYVKGVGRKVNSGNLIASGQDAFMDAVLSFTTLVAALIPKHESGYAMSSPSFLTVWISGDRYSRLTWWHIPFPGGTARKFLKEFWAHLNNAYLSLFLSNSISSFFSCASGVPA